MDDITAELHRLRQDRGLSQWELAKVSGVGRATIARSESKPRQSYSLPIAAMLAKAYGLRLALVPEEEK